MQKQYINIGLFTEHLFCIFKCLDGKSIIEIVLMNLCI